MTDNLLRAIFFLLLTMLFVEFKPHDILPHYTETEAIITDTLNILDMIVTAIFMVSAAYYFTRND